MYVVGHQAGLSGTAVRVERFNAPKTAMSLNPYVLHGLSFYPSPRNIPSRQGRTGHYSSSSSGDCWWQCWLYTVYKSNSGSDVAAVELRRTWFAQQQEMCMYCSRPRLVLQSPWV